MRSSLFWDVTRRWSVVKYRCFGTAYRSHLKGPSSPVISSLFGLLTLEMGPIHGEYLHYALNGLHYEHTCALNSRYYERPDLWAEQYTLLIFLSCAGRYTILTFLLCSEQRVLWTYLFAERYILWKFLLCAEHYTLWTSSLCSSLPATSALLGLVAYSCQQPWSVLKLFRAIGFVLTELMSKVSRTSSASSIRELITNQRDGWILVTAKAASYNYRSDYESVLSSLTEWHTFRRHSICWCVHFELRVVR